MFYKVIRILLLWGFASQLAIADADSKIQGFRPAPQSFLSEPLWGDTHVHSSLSLDAFGYGARLGPDAAFRFAKGQKIKSNSGQLVKLSRPLDFLVLADHSEALGMMEQVRSGNPELLKDDTVKGWNDLMNGGAEGLAELSKMWFDTKIRRGAFARLNELSTDELQTSIWQKSLDIAESHNQPGQFSALLGYEWTSGPGGSNLHRVVMFRDAKEKVGSMLPYTFTQSDRPEDLWDYMARYEDESGGQVLAIPHNGNISNGLMFPTDQSYGGSELKGDYLSKRKRWEPVVEVTQMKGDGEAHPLLSPDDEFADYETWDFGNFAGVKKEPEMLEKEYARSALKSGLMLAEKTGTNPYQFGMIGSTDSHTALATADEDNFFGKLAMQEPKPDRWSFGGGGVPTWKMVASGYAAVWANENTREAIFDAFMRREVYATTGPRIVLRFFGGWDFKEEDLQSSSVTKVGYQRGVPMGGELRRLAAGVDQSPTFMIVANRDPMGANLDRVQIVKGWVDGIGASHERVYEVDWSGDRELNAEGKLAAIGRTIEIETLQVSKELGAPQFLSFWRDPDFDASQRAFYYVRVLEIPTPRWTAYDQQRFDIQMSDTVSQSGQERAYSSPIWYTP